MPAASEPYEFSFPYPPQLKGGDKAGCDAREDANVDLYSYNSETGTWTGPLSGPVYTNPSYLEISSSNTGWKGIAIDVSYEGKIDQSDGHTLIDSVFFHAERCYRASTEFGFSHYLKGQPSDAQISFYYEINANCHPVGKCRVHGSGEPLEEKRDNVPIQIPLHPNSRGGSNWIYEAFLIDGGSKWRIRVRDPYTHKDQIAPIDHDVQDFFMQTVKEYAAQGATGFVTATATRDGALIYSDNPPVMNIVRIYSAK